MKWLRAAIAIACASSLLAPVLSIADTAADLQSQIDQNSSQIDQLNREITQYEAQLEAVASKKQTLQGTLKQLDLQSKKLTTSISITKKQINSTQLQIEQLAGGIANKQASIETGNAGLGESFRTLNQQEAEPLAVKVLATDDVATAWQDADNIATLQGSIQDQIKQLGQEKQQLTDTKTAAEQKKAQLLQQQNTLTTQQGSLAATRKAQSDLLAQTKSQESTFQAILAQKRSQESSLEAALSDLKSKYNQAIKPSDITTPGKGVLRYPLDTVRITQYFGNTPFAATGAYNGKGHNGIDLAAPIGTPVKAALSGTILGTGNTDLIKGCYSFGKWVMIKHNNGINTMYAHLSQINVSKGDSVVTGQVLGYSGETGYATGPHVHFGVYVSAATQIVTLGQATNSTTPCSNAVMPVVPLGGYLNPLNYL